MKKFYSCYNQIIGTGSLKQLTIAFGKQNFKEVFPNRHTKCKRWFLNFLGSAKSIKLIPFVTIIFFGIGQIKFLHLSFLQCLNILPSSAIGIIDQRTSNLATLFSITLVLIGWLLTNISVKEDVSFVLLFKRTYLYPIFYFIISLIACLMICSLLRDEKWFDLGDAIVSAMYLIIAALAAITFLFYRLLKVVGPDFLYSSLENEVMSELYQVARKNILREKSRSIYQKFCEGLGLVNGIKFGTNLTQFNGINITPSPNQNNNTTTQSVSNVKRSFVIRDIKLSIISKEVKKLHLSGDNYYRQLSVTNYEYVPENYFPFFFNQNSGDIYPITKKILSAFKLKEFSKSAIVSNPNLDYLHKRFTKDVKGGDKENIKRSLDIFAKIFELENRIKKEC
jgi:hypothetical protein